MLTYAGGMPYSARSRGRQVNLFQALALLLAFLLIAGVGGVLTAGLLLPAVAATSALTDATTEVFDDLPTELQEGPLSEKSTVLARDGQTVLATFYAQNRIVVPLDAISQDMRDAVIATEDKRFFEHGGIDPTGMVRAAAKNVFTDDIQGASTLTQQYVKNVLIESAIRMDSPEEREAAIAAAREADGAAGISRKLREAKLAIALEQEYSKEEILAKYLNIAQFGASVYGVEAAAQYYFGIPASQLDYLRAATLAGVTQSPTKWDPVLNPINSEQRRNVVLRLMFEQGYIDQAEYDAGVAAPLASYLNITQPQLGCMAANDLAGAGYFCDYVTKVIRNNPAFGETPEERIQLLYRGGLTITTTLDLAQQALADAAVKAGVPVDDPSGVASAIAVVEPGTGEVRAMAQNRIYNNTSTAGPRETSVNYNTDSAYGSSKGFAPGSTFKPFTLVQWLKEGHALKEVLDANLRPYKMSEFDSSCGRFVGPDYRFGNAEGDGGIMTVLNATKNSVNSGYIEMASQLDICGIFDTAKSLGIHTPDGGDYQALPANVLGSDSVAPLTMASAFATFAANGTYCEPIALLQVLDADGQPLPVPSPDCRQVLEPRIAAAMNFALGHVWEGTARGLGGIGRPSAGKTGTTSQNEHTWFVGYTPQLSTAVWVGFAEGTIPVQRMTVNGKFIRNAYGSTIAAPTWQRFMRPAHEGLPVVEFAPPDEREVQGELVRVPRVTGRSPSQATEILREAGFTVRTASDPVASDVRAGRVAETSPGAGIRSNRGTVVTLRLSDGEGPDRSGGGSDDDRDRD